MSHLGQGTTPCLVLGRVHPPRNAGRRSVGCGSICSDWELNTAALRLRMKLATSPSLIMRCYLQQLNEAGLFHVGVACQLM